MPGSAGLAATIARRIRREGPLSLAAYMAIALHDPEAGYYATRDPFGAAGDFITAPEISQIFGELIGACVIDFWQRIGRPDPVILAELGPGRGTLMADLLRAARAVPEFRRALRLHLVEASPVLRQEQQRRLAVAAPELAPRFADGIDALPDGPLLLIANEFLDALPIRQFVRARDRLERTPRRARSRRRPRIGAPGPCRGPGKSRPRAAGSARIARGAARHGCRDMSGRRRPRRLARRAPRAPARPRAVHRLRLFPEPPRRDAGRAAPSSPPPRSSTRPARPISAPMSILPLSPRPRRRPAPRRTVRCRSATSCSPSAPRRGSRRCRGAPPRRSVPRSKAASRA